MVEVRIENRWGYNINIWGDIYVLPIHLIISYKYRSSGNIVLYMYISLVELTFNNRIYIIYKYNVLSYVFISVINTINRI